MHGAVLRGADSVIRFLAEHGGHVDYRNRIGWTPLDIAEALLPGTPKYSRALSSRPEATPGRFVRRLSVEIAGKGLSPLGGKPACSKKVQFSDAPSLFGDQAGFVTK
jgi:hypothetical protein